MSLNYKLSKFMVSSRRFFSWNLPKKDGMNMLQKKAYELFKLYVKDSESELICSIKTSKRHIRNGELLIMLYSSSNGYIMTVIDESNKHNIYDVDVSSNTGSELCEAFDTEMERKLRGCEHEKRMLIVKDLDELMTKKRKDDKSRIS
jgi:hypothetical protein